MNLVRVDQRVDLVRVDLRGDLVRVDLVRVDLVRVDLSGSSGSGWIRLYWWTMLPQNTEFLVHFVGIIYIL